MRLVNVYAQPGATEWLYELLRERSVEDDPNINISHRGLPSWSDHFAFVASKPYRAWYLIDVDGTFVGYVSLTNLNEIGIILARAHRGKGYGATAVKDLMARLHPLPEVRGGHFIANINPNNERSIRLFSALGFKPLQVTFATT